jgi:CDGSH-type Zn-finger protein
MALCRCGLSQNKPLCDGSHDKAFQDDGTLKATRLSDAGTEEVELRVEVARGGPLRLQGPLTLEGADGASCAGSKGALCRCGASDSKPFCDGSHANIDFDAA